jgi:hypothetical protein
MKVFGLLPWGPGFDDPAMMTETPVGAPCLHCGEPIEDRDSGVILPHVNLQGETTFEAQHRECFMRGIVGSVGHQLGRCSCYGGSPDAEGDPPGLTRRAGARAAYLLAITKRGGQ